MSILPVIFPLFNIIQLPWVVQATPYPQGETSSQQGKDTVRFWTIYSYALFL